MNRMKVFGDKTTFCFEIGEKIDSPMRLVNIFIGGKNICCEDNVVYLPQFINSIALSASDIRRKIDYYKYINYFEWMSLEEAHNFLLSTRDMDSPHYNLENDDLYQCHRVFSWGPTTDNAICFLLPMNGMLYLTYSFSSKIDLNNYNSFCGVAITPYEIVHVIIDALNELQA